MTIATRSKIRLEKAKRSELQEEAARVRARQSATVLLELAKRSDPALWGGDPASESSCFSCSMRSRLAWKAKNDFHGSQNPQPPLEGGLWGVNGSCMYLNQ